jgi:hypothetical protein
MEEDIVPTIDLFTYLDDGNLLLALGCVTYQAAHFERVIDDFLKDLTKLNPTRPEGKTLRDGIGDKLNRCTDWLSECYVGRPGLEVQLQVFQDFRRLMARRNEAVHGALYQNIGGPVMRSTTYAKDHAVTSSASLYELATELNLADAAVATGAWTFVHDNSSPAIDASIHTGVIDD